MKAVFADTSFYLAFANPKDALHDIALTVGGAWRGPMVTTDYILVELGNCLCNPANRGLFLQIVRMLREDEKTTVIPASAELLDDGLALFAKRPDKAWSLPTAYLSP